MSDIFPVSEEIKKPEKKPRVLKHDNTWDSHGLIRSRTEKDGEIVVCNKTKKELYYMNEAGSRIMLDSFGNCATCKELFHFSLLKFPDDHGNPPWPIEFEGRYCIECSKAPLTAEEQKEVAQLMR